MFDFKEIQKITRLFLKNNSKKINDLKKGNVLDLEKMEAKWDTIGGVYYYCKGRDLRSKK